MSVATSNRLQVHLPGQRVGELQRERSGRVSWLPLPEWEAMNQRPRLGIAFLRRPGLRHAGTGIPEWSDRHGWGVPGGPTLSLGLGGERHFAMLDMDALTRHSTKSGFAWAKQEAMEGIQRARDGWASVEADMPPLMRKAMNEHWRRVPILKTMAPLEILKGND